MIAEDRPALKGGVLREAARKIAHYAVRVGYLRPEPCELCGRRRSVHAHHVDYTRPLHVRWLCRWCHVAVHAGREHLEDDPAPLPPHPVEEFNLHTYTVHGRTWAELQTELRRQIHEKASIVGFEKASRMLGVSLTTLWRMGNR